MRFKSLALLLCCTVKKGFKVKYTYHRPPTWPEIKFGHGATHYKDFDASVCLDKEGKLKSKLKCPEDGLWYTR